jgi:hypothetical protein
MLRVISLKTFWGWDCKKQNPIIKINSNKTNSNQKNESQIWYKKLKGVK